jgi:hypothetical protein
LNCASHSEAAREISCAASELPVITSRMIAFDGRLST